jgi:hypothetical protein
MTSKKKRSLGCDGKLQGNQQQKQERIEEERQRRRKEERG